MLVAAQGTHPWGGIHPWGFEQVEDQVEEGGDWEGDPDAGAPGPDALQHVAEGGHGHHEHGGGVLFFDMDEAVHGAYLVAGGVGKIANGGAGAIMKDARGESQQLASTPKKWIDGQVGGGSAAMNFALSGVVLPLSFLAIHAGVEEMHEASHVQMELTSRRDRIVSNLQQVEQARVQGSPPEVEATRIHAKRIAQQEQTEIEEALEDNSYNRGIGVNSVLSGAAIGTKVVADTTITAVTMAVSGSSALATATTVVAVAGTVVLAPLAAGGAMALGAYFVHQARMTQQELAEDREIMENPPLPSVGEPTPAEQTYQVFIDRELTAREKFVARFKRWNAGFVCGACLSLVGAVGKAFLGVVALAGAAAFFATPPGMIFLLVVSIIGGCMMAVCSWQFLTMHGKSKEHQNYRRLEIPFVGRDLDRLQALHGAALPDGGNARVAAGLRVAGFECVSGQDWWRQNFLQVCAVDMDKYRARETYDIDDTVPEVSRPRARRRNLFAPFAYAGAYLRSRSGGATHWNAVGEARQARERQRDNLTAFGLAQWFNEDTGEDTTRETAQHDLLINMLTERRDFLAKKFTAYDQLSPHFSETGGHAQAVQQTFVGVREEVRRDWQQCQRINGILANQQLMPLNQLKREFLLLQGVSPDEVPESTAPIELNARFAKYLVEDMPEEVRATRGVLFDMHRRSFRLQRDVVDAREVAVEELVAVE